MKRGQRDQLINRATAELACFDVTIRDTLEYFELLVTFLTFILVNRHTTFSCSPASPPNVLTVRGLIIYVSYLIAAVKTIKHPVHIRIGHRLEHVSGN